jgi:hypothetical protein
MTWRATSLCQPLYPPSIRTTCSRPVKARERRIAWAVASLPVFAICTRSSDGTHARSLSASSTSHGVVPQPIRDSPSSSAWRTAALTSGSSWPRRWGAKAAW